MEDVQSCLHVHARADRVVQADQVQTAARPSSERCHQRSSSHGKHPPCRIVRERAAVSGALCSADHGDRRVRPDDSASRVRACGRVVRFAPPVLRRDTLTVCSVADWGGGCFGQECRSIPLLVGIRGIARPEHEMRRRSGAAWHAEPERETLRGVCWHQLAASSVSLATGRTRRGDGDVVARARPGSSSHAASVSRLADGCCRPCWSEEQRQQQRRRQHQAPQNLGYPNSGSQPLARAALLRASQRGRLPAMVRLPTQKWP